MSREGVLLGNRRNKSIQRKSGVKQQEEKRNVYPYVEDYTSF